jgi:formylglycine-generating enzyme required for sulfatase activity
VAALLAAGLGRVSSEAQGGGSSGCDPVEMVAVPGGDFLMGSDDPEADADERPAKRIRVEAFWIDRVEVTNARYAACVEAGACSLPAGAAVNDATKADHPVSIVSWAQAAAYCRWVGKRLPTESEWEKAARGVDARRYPWGSRFEPDRVNAGYSAGTAAAGSYAGGASPYGVLDMAGNVWEWTSSLYRPYPYDPGDGREDPQAPGARVNRGGSWYYGAWYGRTSYRATANHLYRRIADLGFRCARSNQEPSAVQQRAPRLSNPVVKTTPGPPRRSSARRARRRAASSPRTRP